MLDSKCRLFQLQKEHLRMRSNHKLLKLFAAFSVIFGFLVEGGMAATINARSASYSDVKSAVASADYGDTVVVPAGTVTWTSQLYIQKCLELKGAGAGKTVIEGSYNGNLVNIAPDKYSCTSGCEFRVSGFTFDGNSTGTQSVGVAVGQGHSLDLVPKNIRIHNNEFRNFKRAGVTFNQGKTHSFGLIDNNRFTNCRKALNSYGWYTYSWARLPKLGYSAQNSLGTVNNIYFEDNIVEVNDNYNESFATISSGHGGRWVARFNTIYYNEKDKYIQGHDVHGNNGSPIEKSCPVTMCDDEQNTCCAAGNRGVMVAESYNNTHYINGAKRTIKGMDIRGGTTMTFNEKYVDPDGSHYGFVQIREEDGQDGICADTPGPSGWTEACDPVRDSYIFNNKNTYNNTEANVYEYSSQAEYVEPDYNYWKYNPSNDGRSGVGVGPLANRPSTCTNGVGYWATDQGSWNSTGADGVLYRCEGGRWVKYFEPLEYPHPYRNGEYTSPPPTTVETPQGLRVVDG